MNALKNYTTTFLEYKVVKARLDYLQQKREELEIRYCGPQAINYESTGAKNQPLMADKIMLFINAVTTPNEESGLSLDDEIEIAGKELLSLQETLSVMARTITRLTDIEAQLYRKIVLEGKKVSKAIRETAEENYMSERNVYDRYYSQIKEDIKKVKNGRTNINNTK